MIPFNTVPRVLSLGLINNKHERNFFAMSPLLHENPYSILYDLCSWRICYLIYEIEICWTIFHLMLRYIEKNIGINKFLIYIFF